MCWVSSHVQYDPPVAMIDLNLTGMVLLATGLELVKLDRFEAHGGWVGVISAITFEDEEMLPFAPADSTTAPLVESFALNLLIQK
jgi:hypothetical protein